MASPSRLLSEEQFQCSICLDVFAEPVSTPCGHNFCKACISGYWDSTDLCQCPMCKQIFHQRPELKTNTAFRDVVEHFKMIRIRDTDESPAEAGEVSCDVCTGTRLKALKSCLECLTSFCETHLQPHQRVTGLKRHKLIDPVENLEDRMCKKHDRLLELFCRTDQTCVCQFCIETDHKNHHTVPLEEECGERKVQLGKTKRQIRQMIQERMQKVQEVKHSVELNKRDAEREIADGLQVFTALVYSIQRSQADFMEVVEEKQKAAESRADGLIKELEQEMTELQRRSTELEQHSHTEDHLHLLQSFPSLCTPKHTKDWSEVSVHSDMCLGGLRRAVSELERTLQEELDRVVKRLCDVELKTIQQWSADVTLDPDTAHPFLILSSDRKQVRYGGTWQKLPDNVNKFYNPERFLNPLSVLGKESFSSGRFYYEVQVKGKAEWLLGVARESINRKADINMSPVDGLWTVYMRGEDIYEAYTSPHVPLSLREKPQKVGVFVDYEGGQVSFYNVETRAHIYSFIGCTFTEKLYPYFNTCDNELGPNLAPFVICPVNHTD
ncbi:E3 ubiquitin-protein ligase TRIM39 [Salmo trutta]|uniref:E3 ubiquitin-protein ligase TRIM39-like n=1 Tax=Salmo trutta TaxID=8032 RepID=A0A673WRT5_SALTR|nr:E3 ubiquitin-protein ligase TRIM39-like [Salmo trutta]